MNKDSGCPELLICYSQRPCAWNEMLMFSYVAHLRFPLLFLHTQRWAAERWSGSGPQDVRRVFDGLEDFGPWPQQFWLPHTLTSPNPGHQEGSQREIWRTHRRWDACCILPTWVRLWYETEQPDAVVKNKMKGPPVPLKGSWVLFGPSFCGLTPTSSDACWGQGSYTAHLPEIVVFVWNGLGCIRYKI